MSQQDTDTLLGRFISLVLRHNPAAANIQLDENGWADVDKLIDGVTSTGRNINREVLTRIVQTNSK